MSGWRNDAVAAALHDRRSGAHGAPLLYFACLLSSVLCLLSAGCAKHEPATGQVLRIAQRNEPATLDPQLATLPDEFFIIRALSEGLLTPDPAGGAPLPGAAANWEVSPDGLTYTFQLRPGAKWSNGDPVTSTDFAALIRRVTAPGSLAPKAMLFSAVRAVATPDPHTLVISLQQPVSDFPAIVASGPWIPFHPASKTGQPVGNGPFTLVDWKPNQRITVRKNPLYRDAPAVKLDAIQFLAFDSGDTEERAFRTGQVDVTMAVPFTKLASYRAEQPALLRSVPLHETRYLALNTTRPPLHDPRVRRALALVIDREALAEKVVLSGRPALNFVPPGLGGYAPGAMITADAAEARRLLAAAGFPGGRGFPRLELATWPVNPAQLEAIQQMWARELGLTVTLAPREARTHLAALAAGDYDLAFMTAIPDYDGASDLFQRLTAGSPDNYPHWANADYDRLVAAAGRLDTVAARNAAYQQAEKVLLEAMPVIPLYFNVQNFLVSPAVKDWQADRLWTRFYRAARLE